MDLVTDRVNVSVRCDENPEDKRSREINKELKRVMEIKKKLEVRGVAFADLPLLIRSEALALWLAVQKAG